MDALKIVLLGILQGIGEFLPISSSGHLVFAEELLGGKLESPALNIALHIGTLGSILVVYHERIRRLLSQPRIMLMIVLATLPLVVVGLPLKKLFDLRAAGHLGIYVSVPAHCGWENGARGDHTSHGPHHRRTASHRSHSRHLAFGQYDLRRAVARTHADSRSGLLVLNRHPRNTGSDGSLQQRHL
jgi:Bacitracin resistance protein BacA